jgi:hypothetical protein
MLRLLLALAAIALTAWTVMRLVGSQLPHLSITGAPPADQWPLAPAQLASAASAAASAIATPLSKPRSAEPPP